MCECEARVSQVSTHTPFCHIEILHDIRIWAHPRASKFALQIYLGLLYQPHGPQSSILRVQEHVEQTQKSCPKLAPTYHTRHESFSSQNQLLHQRFPPTQKDRKKLNVWIWHILLGEFSSCAILACRHYLQGGNSKYSCTSFSISPNALQVFSTSPNVPCSTPKRKKREVHWGIYN